MKNTNSDLPREKRFEIKSKKVISCLLIALILMIIVIFIFVFFNLHNKDNNLQVNKTKISENNRITEEYIAQLDISSNSKRALTQYANVLQKIAKNGMVYTENEATEIAQEESRSIECVYHHLQDLGENHLAEIKAILLNSPEKNNAYIAYNKKLSGKIYGAKKVSDYNESCDFDADNF